MGIGFLRETHGHPIFALFSDTVLASPPYEFCILRMVESITQGLRSEGGDVQYPIILHDENTATIIGGGKHYAIGVQNGVFHFVAPEGADCSPEVLEQQLASKMRCPPSS